MSKEPGNKSQQQPPQGMQVKWDDSNMKSSYANVCNAMSTREEVVLMFGVNQAWHAGQKEVTIQLTDRIILSPHAAKRLSMLLTNLVKQHEDRFGALNIEAPRPTEVTKGSSLEN
ncbi:MAG TPA: DUF3467 domain-containing protein [Terriglobia bacterium]|nr:DUF3467 domain-containing protein [Terriglobia bacterium]